ncbi:hypothetical protein [Xanthomonas campestris]|uniref:hypothetical protein n=1 Tax=Xanthomonas campestris TaxID=339 RepID=UPI002379B4ED|nr:hypothetical protein [Xanthomonas campestris]WDJ79134.1 hypothetical protein JH282_03005 [Xanthomonas campestris pv. campestris]
MPTAPSMPAAVPGYLLPASAHGLLWDVGEVLRRLAARAAIESPLKNPQSPNARKALMSAAACQNYQFSLR